MSSTATPTPAPPVGALAVDLPGAFRSAASSTWVVTTATPDGAAVGFTAISVVSVSMAPPMVSFNVSRSSSSLPALSASRRFAVHLLASDQERLARRFAGPAGERFADGAAWSWGADGVPQLDGVVARLAGTVASFVEAGDSLVVLGGVETSLVTERAPLVHHARAYHRLHVPGRPHHAA